MRPVGQVKPRRAALDATEQKMAHGVEADGAQAQGIFDGACYFRQREGLHQPQHLDILAAGVFFEPRFEQASQLSKAIWQLPAGEWCGLVESPALLFQQRQVVNRIVYSTLAVVTARVRSDHLAAADDLH